ncbi:recombinase family protein [Sedimentibacter hydroxybenzoicus DSM 7310]|uniref:Recombinase family protein n=1 Tax=Sedimentibacter hydroxybenzoicus DSM 7310 TaxID=1123245 RepID=A0A974BL45_SEDHY|nr:recombinase family protein [Sedimentibacter hydroxybenzoicus]NYB74968.1 recombinase family protein [Sedimentibacter hydroxybenzoicus DSM 7310]
MENRIDAIYGRQSVDKKESISIESQFEFCRYELKGGECKEYKDKGYSGKNIERPDFQRLLTDIRNGLIKRVIVYKLDRISRFIVDFAKLMEIFKQYNVEFVSCTEKFDTSTPMGRAMLNICIVFAQLERESIQQRVQDAFYSRCSKGYYMRGRPAYGFDLEPIVINGIKTKKLVENESMSYALLMYEMYEVPEASYGDISRHFAKHNILVYGKTLKRGFIAQLLRNPVYVQADMDIYEYFKAQGVKIENDAEDFTGEFSCYLYQGREGEEKILVLAPHEGKVSSRQWLNVQHKLSQNTTFQNGRKCHHTWLAGKIKCGCCGYALTSIKGQNDVTYFRCKQRLENKSCEGAGTLTKHVLEDSIYNEMVQKMQEFQTLTGGKQTNYNPKLTTARAGLAKIESEIEKLLDTLTGANPTLLKYANNRIEDAQRQAQTKLIADLSANSVSSSQIELISGYLSNWGNVEFDDRRRVIDALVNQIQATSEHVSIQWKI